MEIKGYKVFNPDWTCHSFQYTCPGTFEMNDEPIVCKKGFHFCRRLIDCFNYYDFDPENKVAEILALGNIDFDSDGIKYCTNKIKIVRKLTWKEVLELVNIGIGCEGKSNSGDYNRGSHNTGNKNKGNSNTGYRNLGNYNVGYYNNGHFNVGDYNLGNHNVGNSNIGSKNIGSKNIGIGNVGSKNVGNYNVGDYNVTSFNTGCFTTKENKKIDMFNKPSNWTYEDWLHSRAKNIIDYVTCHSNLLKINSKDFLLSKVVNDSQKKTQEIWDELPKEDKIIVKALPNFDERIFKECTGITV